MQRSNRLVSVATILVALGCTSSRKVERAGEAPPAPVAQREEPEKPKRLPQAVAPKEFLPVPPQTVSAIELAPGYHAEIVLTDLTYPTSAEPDEHGNLYVAEAGYSYGDLAAPARIHRLTPKGDVQLVADQLAGPVNDLLWHDGRLYLSQRGKISVLERDGRVRDLVTGLPSYGDHHTDSLAAGKDGFIYFGQGTATNSGVVGLDNVYPFLWLTFWPDVHDIPAKDLTFSGQTFTTPDALTVLAHSGELVSFLQSAKHLVSPGEPLLVKTGPFAPFGKSVDRAEGQLKANGTVMRMHPDGSGLELYAWGFRNPYGLQFAPDGSLWATDEGYDERGSRPIANAPDCVWKVRQGGFYGFPDFACGEPVTEAKFRSSRGEPPKPLLKDPPPVEKPVLTRPAHATPVKFDFAPEAFGFGGQLFVAELGGGGKVNASDPHPSGNMVARIDPRTGEATPFMRTRPDALGTEPGYAYATTRGLRRPIAARFTRSGDALYVVDFGAIVAFPAGAGPALRPYPDSGSVWRVVRDGTKPKGPPAGLSILAGRERR